MAAKRRAKQQPGVGDLVAALLAAHGHDVHALIRTLTAAGVARSGPAGDVPRPRFQPRPRPAAPVTFRLRVDVDEARPPIWRRLDLAGDLTLGQVHRAVQAAFMWGGYHLHAFTPEVDGMRDRFAPSFANDDLDDLDMFGHEDEVRLDEVVSRVGDRLFYMYDFGDSWGHTLKVEQVRPRRRGPSAACVGGRRAAPMEDCGGIWRYNEIVAALAGKESTLDAEEIADVRQWYGGEFDPAFPGLDDLADLDPVVFGTDGDRLVTFPDGTGDAPTEPDHAATSPLVGNPRLAPAFVQLVDLADAAGVLPTLDELVAAADLDVTSEPRGAPRSAVFAGLPRQEAEAMTEPWRALVRSLGTAGAPVAADGTVTAPSGATADSLFTVTGEAPPEALRSELVSAGLALGLLRKKGDRVYATRAGVDAAADPIRMWRHLADRMTRGPGRSGPSVGALALLVIAAGDRPVRTAFADLAEELLPALGIHRPAMGPAAEAGFASSETVWVIMEVCGGFSTDGHATVPARRLARAALLTT